MSTVNELILKAVLSCDLQRQGTFYFVFSHVDSDKRNRYTLTFVDECGKMSTSSVFGLLPCDKLGNAIALNLHTVLIVPQQGPPFTLETSNNWKTLNIPSSDSKEVLRAVIDGLLVKNTPRENALSRVRSSKKDCDFVIECEDGEIPVHSIILRPSWQFFDSLLESGMKEAAEKRLKLPYPKKWVQLLVGHLYDEQYDMTFEEATGVIVMAAVYDLPDLHASAMRRIRDEILDVTKASTAWKRAYETQNDALMEYCGAFIAAEMRHLHNKMHLLQDFSQEELLRLFSDMSHHADSEAKKEASVTPCPKSPSLKSQSPLSNYNYTAYGHLNARS